MLGVRCEEHWRIAEEWVVGLRVRERKVDRRDAELETLETDPAGTLYEGRWILLDYVDCVVHIFTPDVRDYYRLETLWGEVPAVEAEE